MIKYRYCGLDKIVKARKSKSEKYGVRQIYLCKNCGKRFVKEPNAVRYSNSFKEHVIKCIVFEGLGIRQDSRSLR